MADETKLTNVRCPEPFVPLFTEAEKIMSGFFGDLVRRPEEGDIQISGTAGATTATIAATATAVNAYQVEVSGMTQAGSRFAIHGRARRSKPPANISLIRDFGVSAC